MESVHGVDVSWMMKHSSSKEHSKSSPIPIIPKDRETKAPNENGNTEHTPKLSHRPSFTRSNSGGDKTATLNGNSPKSASPSPSSSRRNSWLSSISSKFSSNTHNAASQPANPPISELSPVQESPVPTGPSAPKNAVLPHAIRPTGDVPYTPAPPKSTQPGFLQSAFRRLSSSSGVQMSSGQRGNQHGLCERRVLNIDKHRERCQISDLDQNKLRRVAFCVDVEIASGPRYSDESPDEVEKKKERKEKKKLVEKGEGEALKRPQDIKNEKEEDGIIRSTGEELPVNSEKITINPDLKDGLAVPEKDNTKKREKKKRSEEERKARKEKKRKLAEANGTVPVELIMNESNSSLEESLNSGPGTTKTQASPTTDPVRIYRRCCQLRETPILKRITEQLAANSTGTPGVVSKLDLTGYWLQLPDVVTLGDYLAVVPVKEIVMENTGLTDEGVRVILAGLLAAKRPDLNRRRTKHKDGDVPQGGFVERVAFTNNPKIGRDGWRHICLFINMCRSLKSMDLSKLPFPQTLAPPAPTTSAIIPQRTFSAPAIPDVSCVLSKALGDRLAGRNLELLNLAETGLTTEQLGGLFDGAIKSGLRRLGIAGNKITPEGLQHVARFLRDGTCEGLDLGGNDIKDQLGVIADALDEDNILYALSLADCGLTPESLWALFPALVKLKNFRFIDLSQNHALFDTQPSALSLLRRYLPKLPMLKRIHLSDVSMTPEQAIALAEILPESRSLAHVNLMENSQLAALADAKDEFNQEEACALYASLMAAVRVSQTIICIDIEVPSSQSSEVVKALAKQVVAYCLRNMERGPVAEISQAVAQLSEPHGGEKEVAVPDVLLHLVGHVEGYHDHADEPAPDEDYVIGGTGVVKALGICLRNNGHDSRRPSAERTFSNTSEGGSGSGTPSTPVRGGKAKDMSKNLLGSARKIRARLQPALVKESGSGDRSNYQRLLFLDTTLEGMIKRFEDEYPETRVPSSLPSSSVPAPERVNPFEHGILSHQGPPSPGSDEAPTIEPTNSDDEDGVRPVLSRHNSDVSLASRAFTEEEGRMHRFGMKFRRDILKSDEPEQPRHLELLRAMVDGLEGNEIKKRLEDQGQEAVLEELSNEASALRRQLVEQDPEGWERFVESQNAAKRNTLVDVGSIPSESAVE